MPAVIATGVGEVDLLPAARRLVGEGRGRQQRAGGAPQVGDMGPGVQRPLVEADAGDCRHWRRR